MARDSKEKELLEEIKDAPPEEKEAKTQELLDYFKNRKSSKKKKVAGKSFSDVKSSLRGGRKASGGITGSSAGSSTGGPIAAGTGASILSFGSLIGKKISNAFENAKEEKERAQQAEASGADIPDEVKEKGYFIKKALGYEFGGRAFDTSFGNFVASMPSKQTSKNSKFSDQFDWGENDPKNKSKEKTIPQILAKGFNELSKSFGKVSSRLTRQNNLLAQVLEQTSKNGEILESIKNSIASLSALEMQSEEDAVSAAQQSETIPAPEFDQSSQEMSSGIDIADILGSIDDALDIADNLKKGKKKPSQVRGRKTRRSRRPRPRFFGRRVKFASGGITTTGLPAMVGEAGPELVVNRFNTSAAFGISGIKGGEFFGLAQPLTTAMEIPIKIAGGNIISIMGGFLRSAGPLGGVLAPMFGNFIMPLSTIFGVNQTVVNSALFGGIASLRDSANLITGIFKKVFGILNLGDFFGRSQSGGGGGPSAKTTPGKVIQGGDADFWSLAAVASLEGVNPQGEADVAQAVYNRVASGVFSVKTIKDAILSPGQFQPVTSDNTDINLWRAIKDRESAIAAVASHNNKGVQTATKYVDEGARNITNPSLQKSAAEFVGGRTDFAVPSAAQIYPGGIADRTRHGHLFGWYVGPGSIAYGRKNPGPASVPDFKIKAETGISKDTANPTSVKYTIINGPNSGYQVPPELVNNANVEGHGQELVQTSAKGFKIFPLENNKYSLTKDPKSTVDRWSEISGGSKPQQIKSSYSARGGGGLKMPKLTPLYHGTSARVGRLINENGFRASRSGVLGPGVYGSRSKAVADSYRGAGALKGLVRGKGPRLQMLVPQNAGRTFRGATVIPEKTANKGYKLAKKLNAGAYPRSARANQLRAMLKGAAPVAAKGAGLGFRIASAARLLNVPASIIMGVFEPKATADATLEAAMKDPKLRKYMKDQTSFVPVVVNQAAPQRPMIHTTPSTTTPPDYRRMAKNNAMLRYS